MLLDCPASVAARQRGPKATTPTPGVRMRPASGRDHGKGARSARFWCALPGARLILALSMHRSGAQRLGADRHFDSTHCFKSVFRWLARLLPSNGSKAAKQTLASKRNRKGVRDEKRTWKAACPCAGKRRGGGRSGPVHTSPRRRAGRRWGLSVSKHQQLSETSGGTRSSTDFSLSAVRLAWRRAEKVHPGSKAGRHTQCLVSIRTNDEAVTLQQEKKT